MPRSSTRRWLKAAFLLLLVGYGTKMGLAPLHTWLPDAHSEAPSVVSALLSGALLNCAFLAILRMHGVCVAAGLAEFSKGLFVLFGVVSMAVAAVFIVGQSDYKTDAGLLERRAHGDCDAWRGRGGNRRIRRAPARREPFPDESDAVPAWRGTSSEPTGRRPPSQVTGVLRVLPVSGALWLAGFFAITGSPPFGLFVSELTILKGTLDARRFIIAAAYLALLLTVFVGMAMVFLRMAHGTGSVASREDTPARERFSAIVPPAVLGLAVLVLGLYVPGALRTAIDQAIAGMRLF